MNDSTASAAVVEAPAVPAGSKPKARKAKAAPANGKKANGKVKVSAKAKAKKAAKPRAEKSNRLALFQALGRNDEAGGLTSSEARAKIGMAPSNGQFGVLIRGEIEAKRIKVQVWDVDGRNTNYYTLTAKGKEHLKDGKVDSWARENGLVGKGRGE